jgi:putative ABC transport system permease protein
MTILIRAGGDPAPLMASMRTRVLGLDRNLPVQRPGTIERTFSAGLARRRFSTLLLTSFAGLAMALAAIGIYGLLSYWVTIREPEIAVRLALGARPSGIMLWTSLHALRLALIGIALGMVGGWAAARGLEDVVFGVRPGSPGTLITAALAVAAVAIVAAGIPAWHAARVDPARHLYSA